MAFFTSATSTNGANGANGVNGTNGVTDASAAMPCADRADRAHRSDRPAAKALTRKGEQTRSRIVEAAAKLMYERGVTEATLEEVRAAAGVSGSQIYHYFADKQALLLAVIEHQADAVVDQQHALVASMDSLPALRQWRDALVELQLRLQCRGGCPIGSLGSEVAESNPQARLAVVAGFVRWEGAIRDGISAMHARGELDADPDDLALALLTALQGGLLMTQIRREVHPLETVLDAMLDLVESHLTPVGVAATRAAEAAAASATSATTR